MFKKIIPWAICLSVLLTNVGVWGQQILLDEPIKAGQLTLFPSISDPNTLYYLTDKPKIATGADGKPQFSFLRYVQNNANTADKEGEGGGIVHAVIVLEVTPEQRREAEQALQSIRPGAKIQGPAIFSSGTIALISSVAQPNGDFAKQVLGLGKAPLLDGQKAAISVQLTKLGAKVLWESFKTPTPDMSISFEMTLQGYRSPKRVLIEANFDQVYENHTMQLAAAVNGPVLLAGEITQAFEDLRKTGAIKVTQIGTDENLEKALETAYNKLVNMMFDPAGGTGSPTLGQMAGASGIGNTSLLDRATTMLRDERKEAQQQNAAARRENRETAAEQERLRRESDRPGSTTASTTSAASGPGNNNGEATLRDDVVTGPGRPLRDPERYKSSDGNDASTSAPQVTVPTAAVMASYQMKRIHQQGIFKIDLNKYTVDNLVLRFDENFGQIKCEECFHEANLDDPLFQQREVYSYLDGFNSEDFGKYINFVNVTIRKQHETGEVTDQEIRVDKTNFNETGNNFKVVYGWKNDNNRLKWLNYNYKIVWNYFGGFSQETDWISSSIGTIPLSSPYVRKLIDIEGDPDNFAQENVRGAEVKIYYMLGDKEQVRTVRLNPKGGQLSAQIDVLMPANKLDYQYEINWFLKDGSSKSSGKKPSSNSIIYADVF